MWTKENRRVYERLRYPVDLTDEEWMLVERLIPPAKRGGRWQTVDILERRCANWGLGKSSVPAPPRASKCCQNAGSCERTFGWLGRRRRLAKDFENLPRMPLAFLRLAMIRLMLRRIARHRES